MTPYIPDYFNKLGDAKYYSKIDLKEAYSQLSNTERAIEVTAFICEFGLYEYIGMPMGISSAPAVFQRYMAEVLREFIERKVAFPYLDDILIYTESAEEHIKVLNEVIEVLKKHGLKISGKKCVILTNEIEFLGHIISKGTIKPLPTRAKAINGMKRQETVQEMQRFLGMANYCRDSIKNYAEIAKPLYDSINVKHIPENSKLRKKNGQVDGKKVIIEWTEVAELSFNRIKNIMSSDLILKLPDFKHPFIVTTDASDVGYGAVLEQIIEGENRIISYFSRCMSPAQKNYCTAEKELLGIVEALDHWSDLLLGKKFEVYSDHMPLQFLLSKNKPSQRLERYMLRLSRFNFEIKYKKGAENIVADFLSRLAEGNELPKSKTDFSDEIVAMVELNELVSGRLDVAEEVEMNDLECLIITSDGMDEFEPLSDGLKKQCEDYEIKFIIDVIKKYGNDLKLTVAETAEIAKNPDLKTYIQVYEKLCLVEDILYLREEDFSGINHYRYVLPKNMIEYCFKKIHCDNYAGHLGQKRP